MPPEKEAMIQIGPVTLEGHSVRVEPLSWAHEAELAPLAMDEAIWRYLPASLATTEAFHGWMDSALRAAESGTEVPFVIIDRSSGALAGSTRFFDIRPTHRAVEIGHTWLGRNWWRSVINSETKYLLLRHLFDTLGCQRVSLKTDRLNERSQQAIERLGATREGVLRKHMIVQGGRARDTVYFSILDDEWPTIRDRMERELYGEVSRVM
jgi:RimJ/RimL family protein N-acetyltransferase